MPTAVSSHDELSRLSALLGSLTASDLAELYKCGVRYDPEAKTLSLTKEGVNLARELEWERCLKDPAYFLLDSGLVKSLDRKKKYWCASCRKVLAPEQKRKMTECPRCKSPVFLQDPVQPFPSDKPYLYDIIHVLATEETIALPKSREMLATEIVCSWIFYCGMFEKGTQAIIQSEQEQKAAMGVERIHGYWSRLPEWMKRRRDANPSVKGDTIYNRFEIPATHFTVEGLAQGEHQIREKHPTIYFGDEMSYWPRAAETYGAVRPITERGCQMILVSTAADGGGGPMFRAVCLDELDSVA